MLAIVAWRNVWRNKVRSLVVIFSIAMGLWAGIFIMSFSWGMHEKHIREAIKCQLYHIQLHHPSFKENKDIRYIVPESDAIINEIKMDESVLKVAGRMTVVGMMSSTTAGSGVNINGVNANAEDEITHLSERVVDGTYFKDVKRNPILIGAKLADKLKLKVKSKVVLTFQDKNRDITAGSFRVVGIYKSNNTTFDELYIYADIEDINRLLGYDKTFNEIAVLLNEKADLEGMAAQLHAAYPELLVETWKDLAPELELIIESFSQFMYIFIIIILLGLAFGIVNTMLMAVLERTRELGMLMAIGMNKARIFFMIMLETVYLAIIGGPLGMLLAFVTVKYTGYTGIDLSMFSEGLASFGMETMVHPKLEVGYYFEVAFMAVMAALLSSIYPARKALKLNPSEAIRKI